MELNPAVHTAPRVDPGLGRQETPEARITALHSVKTQG